jgi:hypothetical protein
MPAHPLIHGLRAGRVRHRHFVLDLAHLQSGSEIQSQSGLLDVHSSTDLVLQSTPRSEFEIPALYRHAPARIMTPEEAIR